MEKSIEKWLQGKVEKWSVKSDKGYTTVWYEAGSKLHRATGTHQECIDKISVILYSIHGIGYYSIDNCINEIIVENGKFVVAHVTCLSSLEKTQELVGLLRNEAMQS
jgi:hypothetical protein